MNGGNASNQDALIRVFIGFDPREEAAFHVLSRSIHARASQPVCITPLILGQMSELMWRERHPLQSTDFSFSRFLTPYLAGFNGWTVFMDCDMLMVDDIASLWALRDDDYAVMVVKHDHQPTEATKFLNQPQTSYDKKNWSSVMMFNGPKCTALTPDYVNTATGLELHQFKWLDSDDKIGGLPRRWNYLVDYYPHSDDVSLLHYTTGGPYFDDYVSCDYAEEWFRERDATLFVDQAAKAAADNRKRAKASSG